MTRPFELNLRHLRAIPLITTLGSVSAAADGVSLSQPALTQGLVKIERQIDATLFERRADGMTATPLGAAFAERIDAAFSHLAGAAGRGSRGFARAVQSVTATQLRAILAVAAAGSFAEAARAAGLSQPAVHRAVRDLERLAGVSFVERRGRGVALTSEGRRLARSAGLASAELTAAIAEAQPDAGMGGRLVVGAMPLSRARVVPSAIAALAKEAPRATITVVEGSWRELVEPLRDGAIDLMIGALREVPPVGLVQEPSFVDRLAVVGRAHHPLAHVVAPTLADLAEYPWIVGTRGSPLREQWHTLFADASRPPAPVECGSVMTIRGILQDSDCLTLLSPDQIALEIGAGVLALIGPPREDMLRAIGVTTRSGRRPTALEARFRELLARP